MREELQRAGLLFGSPALEKLQKSRVAIFGVGGVGGYVAEALARGGVGALDLIDCDTVAKSNMNRQILATYGSLGKKKVDVAAARIADINDCCSVRTHDLFFTPRTEADAIDFSDFDYVVDAIDTVSGKIEIVLRAQAAGVPAISSMGTGFKLDPTKFEVADIYETSVCPLARVMRRELKKRGIKGLKVVYSREEPRMPAEQLPPEYALNKPPTASCSFVPPVAGMIIAGEVIKDLIKR